MGTQVFSATTADAGGACRGAVSDAEATLVPCARASSMDVGQIGAAEQVPGAGMYEYYLGTFMEGGAALAVAGTKSMFG